MIAFNIPDALVAGAHTINLLAALPAITTSMTLDATTEPDWAGSHPVVELNFNGVAGDGLSIAANSVTVRGFAINRFGGDGIAVTGGSGDLFEQNFIGTDVTGTIDRGTGDDGIDIRAGIHVIRDNLLSGNNGAGLEINGGSQIVTGNIVGLDAGGTVRLGNTAQGILVNTGGNQIGGTTVPARNIVSGNFGPGIWVAGGVGNVVQGNWVGLTSSGSAVIGNGAEGIAVTGAVALVGGTVAGAGNVVSGNTTGISVWNGSTVQGNLIGTDAAGTADLGNTAAGINVMGSNNLIGGAVAESAQRRGRQQQRRHHHPAGQRQRGAGQLRRPGHHRHGHAGQCQRHQCRRLGAGHAGGRHRCRRGQPHRRQQRRGHRGGQRLDRQRAAGQPGQRQWRPWPSTWAAPA